MDLHCIRWGNEYGGFYLPESMTGDRVIVYSFGIGEDLSFSEDVICRGGYVYAFDPTPRAIQFVAKHKLSKSSQFHFYPYGISNNDGKVPFYLPRNKKWVSGSEILQKNVDPNDVVYVDMYCLKTIAAKLSHRRIDVLKLDVEGSEFKVIRDIMSHEKDLDIHFICLENHERFFKDGDRKIKELLKTMKMKEYNLLYKTEYEWTFMNSKL